MDHGKKCSCDQKYKENKNLFCLVLKFKEKYFAVKYILMRIMAIKSDFLTQMTNFFTNHK